MALTALVWLVLSCLVVSRVVRAYAYDPSAGEYRVQPLPPVYRYTAIGSVTRWQDEPETIRPRNRFEARRAAAIARRDARKGSQVRARGQA